jgi:hypothetical protein
MTDIHSCSYYCDRPECIKTQRDELRDRLAQPEQEPWRYRIWNDDEGKWELIDDCSWPAEPLYTIPPQRTWVGLTKEIVAYIDAKLKELNHERL